MYQELADQSPCPAPAGLKLTLQGRRGPASDITKFFNKLLGGESRPRIFQLERTQHIHPLFNLHSYDVHIAYLQL
jgi:hypothetical protein